MYNDIVVYYDGVVNRKEVNKVKKLTANMEIREELKNRKLSFFDLAEKLGVCEQTVFRMLRKELSAEEKADLMTKINEIEVY